MCVWEGEGEREGEVEEKRLREGEAVGNSLPGALNYWIDPVMEQSGTS